MRNALNIYKRKDGRFEGRIPFGRNDNGSLKYRYFYSKDLAELKDKMLSAYTSIEKYNTISCAKTLSEICAEWLSCAKLRVKRSSYCCYERNINKHILATVYKGNIIKNLIMDCQSYTKYRPNETTGGIFVSWRRKEELPTGA